MKLTGVQRVFAVDDNDRVRANIAYAKTDQGVFGAYYGYDVKEKVFVKQFDKIVNIFGHDDLTNYETDSDADENPAT